MEIHKSYIISRSVGPNPSNICYYGTQAQGTAAIPELINRILEAGFLDGFRLIFFLYFFQSDLDPLHVDARYI